MLYLQTPHLPAEVDAEEDIQDEEYDGKDGEPGCEAVELGYRFGDFDRDFDGVRDAVVPGDADGVGVVQRVPAIAVGGVPTVDIDGVGNAIPSSGGHLSKTDGHAVADILADAIRSGINAKVSAVASVGRGHGDVAGGVAATA